MLAALCACASNTAGVAAQQSNTCSPTALAEVAAAAAELTPQEVQVAQAVPIATAANLTRRDLPRARPAQPWPYRSLSTAQSAPPPTTNASTGVTTITVVHAPLDNVTVDMLRWWFQQDLETVAPYIGDGKNYR